MDLRLDDDEQELVRSLRLLFARSAGPARAAEHRDDLDRGPLAMLDEAGFLDIATVDGGSTLWAALVAEEAARAAVQAPIAARTVVAPTLLPGPLPAAVGLADRPSGALVRFGGHCDMYLVLCEDRAFHATADEVHVEPVETRWGCPLGRLELVGGRDLGPGSGDTLRRMWRIAVAIDMAGAMAPALELTATYVRERRQFGRPLGSFQAVQHRLAYAHVLAEGALWMARKAAWLSGDDAFAAAAANFAGHAARAVHESTHQVSGAMGITDEHGLTTWTNRLVVLERELGGRRSHAAAAAKARWGKFLEDAR